MSIEILPKLMNDAATNDPKTIGYEIAKLGGKVIPIKGKKPSIKGFKDEDGYMSTRFDVLDWWHVYYPPTGIGLCATDFVGIDLDLHKVDEDGIEGFYSLLADNGKTWEDVATFAEGKAKGGKVGGIHLYYLKPKDYELKLGQWNNQLKKYKGIDLRVIPNGYMVVKSESIPFNDNPIAELPKWLHDAILKATGRPLRRRRTYQELLNPVRPQRPFEGKATINKDWQGIEESGFDYSNRNQHAYEFAKYLGFKVAEHGLDINDARDRLERAYKATPEIKKNSDGKEDEFTRAEFEKTANSGFNKKGGMDIF